MFNSLRYRLLSWFIAFMLLTVGLIIPANLFYHSHEKRINQVVRDVNSLYVAFLKDTKCVNDFLTTEPVSTDFYTRGNDPYLNSHLHNSRNLYQNIRQIGQLKYIKAYAISEQLFRIEGALNNYNQLFDSLVYLVYKRGYRNFGLEGELADYAGMIETAPGLTSRDIYLLKKTEKDYLINNDTVAAAAMQVLLSSLSESVSLESRLTGYEKAKTIGIINGYAGAFSRLAELDRQAGIKRNQALRASLNAAGTQAETLFAELTAKTTQARQVLISRLNTIYIFTLLMILSLAFLFSYLASKHVVSQLEALTSYISSLAKSNPNNAHTIDLHNAAREIRQIYREFRNVLSQSKLWENQRDKAIQHADDHHQRYQELTDMLPQSVFETDSYGNYTYVNKAWFKSFGYSVTDLSEGLNLIETLIAESSQEDIMGVQKMENSSFIAIRKDGSRFPASVYTDNIVINGKRAGKRGIIIDITDRVNYIRTLQQETRKAKTSDELKSSFLANMSHEIRTPMNSIIGFSNLLASEQIPDVQKKDFTHYIRTSSEVLLNLVDDIIDIAKIEAGELKVVKKDCELRALGNELLTTSLETQKRFNKRHIQLNFRPDPQYDVVYLKTDPFRLRQVLVNLVNNAIKFTEKGSVDFGYTVKDDTTIEFYVKDTGPGMTREELDMIFERFRRTRRSEEKNIVGTGLGLAISKNLVQLLGGEMWVDSTAGIGTSFVFTLPFLKPTVLPADTPGSCPHENEYKWNNKTLLVVEDDLNSFRYLSELLSPTGAEIIHAQNGKKAVEIVMSSVDIDLVVMDIQLPEMDGLEATRQIKKAAIQLPVIAQTAYAMAGDKEKMKQAGCDDYLPKPLDAKQVLATINYHLKPHKQAGPARQSASSIRNQSGIITN